MGDGDDIVTEWTTLNGIAQTCFSDRTNSFFKVHHPSTKTKGFSVELSIRDTYSTGVPPPWLQPLLLLTPSSFSLPDGRVLQIVSQLLFL